MTATRIGLLARLRRWLAARAQTTSEPLAPMVERDGPPPAPTLAQPSVAPPPSRARPSRKPPEPQRKKPAPARRTAGPKTAGLLTSRFASVEGARVHAVERAGREGAPTVVLIHGAGVDHRDWTFAFLDALPRSWRLLVFDRPGFGDSERPRGPSAALPASQARRLRGAARLLGCERATIVGHSWGGAVAMAWALDAPETARGVVSLAGAVAPWSFTAALENGRRIREAARASLGEGGMRAAAETALGESFNPQPVPAGYVEHIATELTPLTGPAAATMADVSTINGALSLLTPRYGGLERPVELVYGDADAILSVSEQGEAAAALLPNARLTVLNGVGHMVHHAAPETCASAIERIVSLD